MIFSTTARAVWLASGLVFRRDVRLAFDFFAFIRAILVVAVGHCQWPSGLNFKRYHYQFDACWQALGAGWAYNRGQ